jgi:7,8-dihydropterin-6-yl-methyl-4-(beta-D-ribofuranosyl)aminobenzene 5'-phosphate synthase
MRELLLTLTLLPGMLGGARGQEKRVGLDELTFTILYNDVALNGSFAADQGFSSLVKVREKVYLFDAGRIDEALAQNVAAADVDISQVELIFISHLHSDHIGGLKGIIEQANHPALYLPADYPTSQTARGRTWVEESVNAVLPYVGDTIHLTEATRLNDYLYSTGPFEHQSFEQAMVIDTKEGLVVLTGCSHPGIVDIVRRARSLLDRGVYLVMGGFHLAVTDSAQVEGIARELRGLTRKIAPCHCTGERAQEIIRAVFGEDYLDVKAGMSFSVERLRSGLYRTRPSRADHPEGPVARWDVYELIARVLDHLADD